MHPNTLTENTALEELLSLAERMEALDPTRVEEAAALLVRAMDIYDQMKPMLEATQRLADRARSPAVD